jgi:hypothetical protein
LIQVGNLGARPVRPDQIKHFIINAMFIFYGDRADGDSGRIDATFMA